MAATSWAQPPSWVSTPTRNSLFLRHVERASATYGVDLRSIPREVRAPGLVGGQEMIVGIAFGSGRLEGDSSAGG